MVYLDIILDLTKKKENMRRYNKINANKIKMPEQKRIITISQGPGIFQPLATRLEFEGHEVARAQGYSEALQRINPSADLILAEELFPVHYEIPEKYFKGFNGRFHWGGVAAFYALRDAGNKTPYIMIGDMLGESALRSEDKEVLKKSLENGMLAHINIMEHGMGDLTPLVKEIERVSGLSLSSR